MQTDSASRPRIWAVGISRLRALFIDIAGAYADRAELDVVPLGYEDAARSIEGARDERPDVVVAGGSNGAYLKGRVSVPVVVISPTGFDVMHALGCDLLLVCSTVSPDALGGIDRAAADLRELGERAARRGLHIGYEALAWGRHVNDYRDAWEVVRRAGHPARGRGRGPAGVRAGVRRGGHGGARRAAGTGRVAPQRALGPARRGGSAR